MLILKDDSIELDNIHPALVLVICGTVVPVMDKFGIDYTITSGGEQNVRHSWTSLHFAGRAVDSRTHDPATGKELAAIKPAFNEIKRCLNCDFDLIDEGDHWHLEFQPKRRFYSPASASV